MKKKTILFLAVFDLFLSLVILFLSIYYLFQPPLTQSLKTLPAKSLPHLQVPKKETLHPPSKLTLVATGDTMLGRYVNIKMHQKNDFTYPFQKILPFIKEADLAFTNLESPLADPCPRTPTGMLFCADKKALEGLIFSEFDILNLANNHILNYSQNGLEYTIKSLKENNLHPLYCHQNYNSSTCPLYLTLKNQRLAFLGYNLITYPNQSQQIIEDIQKTRPKVDLLIVSLHWGAEYQKKPAPHQIELAHQIIESGADLIIGHHPHVIQPVETYQDKLILYSLGNLVFDQPWSEATKTGLLVKITFEDQKINQIRYQKVYIEDYCQPQLLPNN